MNTKYKNKQENKNNLFKASSAIVLAKLDGGALTIGRLQIELEITIVARRIHHSKQARHLVTTEKRNFKTKKSHKDDFA